MAQIDKAPFVLTLVLGFWMFLGSSTALWLVKLLPKDFHDHLASWYSFSVPNLHRIYKLAVYLLALGYILWYIIYCSLLTVYVNPVFPIMILLIFKITHTDIYYIYHIYNIYDTYNIYVFVYINACIAYMFVGALHVFLMLSSPEMNTLSPGAVRACGCEMLYRY